MSEDVEGATRHDERAIGIDAIERAKANSDELRERARPYQERYDVVSEPVR